MVNNDDNGPTSGRLAGKLGESSQVGVASRHLFRQIEVARFFHPLTVVDGNLFATAK